MTKIVFRLLVREAGKSARLKKKKKKCAALVADRYTALLF